MTANKYEIALDVTKENFNKINREIPPSLRVREESLYANLMNSNLGPLKRLEVLYGEMDTIYSFVKKFSQCKKGCNHCCQYDEIVVSEIEVEYIKKNVKMKWKIKPQRSKACPFLKKGVCSIYPYRPFLCRRHLSLADSERWCEKDICNKYVFPQIKFDQVDRCYVDIIGLDGPSSFKDIRDAFPRA